MSNRFCGFDIDRVGSLKKALEAVPGSAGQLSRDIASAVEEADRIALAAAGLSNRAFYDEAVSYDTDPDRAGLRTVSSAGPDTAAEIGRRLAHLLACQQLAHDGFTVDASDAFADAPPPDEAKIKAALSALRAQINHKGEIDPGAIGQVDNQVCGLSKTETEAFVGALSDDELGQWNILNALATFTGGVDETLRVSLASSLLSKLPTDDVRRVAAHMNGLEPSFADTEGAGNADQKDLHWVWPDGSLYNGQPNIEEITQGDLGDCWFLAALGAEVQENPQFIQQHMTDNGNGTYTVTFYRDGQPVPITVDGQLPYNSWDQTAFTHPGDANWPAIYEKAFAQFHGSYSSIEGGYGADGLSALSGTKATKVPPAFVSPALLQAAIQSGHPVTAGTDSHHSGFLWLHSDEYFDGGKLVTLHEYTVESIDTSKNPPEVTLRNPWGAGAAAPEIVHLIWDEFTSHYTEVSLGE
ncbi:MAG: hypothetical protein J0H43_13050 [Actinobacteria bacterium]|nr:hypothetical protein [Actinomycetota bacterium]